MAFEPRRPFPPVVVDDRSLPRGSYPTGAQAEEGSSPESRHRSTVVPLAHVPTVVLQNDTQQEAKFPNPIREVDHEVLRYPSVRL